MSKPMKTFFQLVVSLVLAVLFTVLVAAGLIALADWAKSGREKSSAATSAQGDTRTRLLIRSSARRGFFLSARGVVAAADLNHPAGSHSPAVSEFLSARAKRASAAAGRVQSLDEPMNDKAARRHATSSMMAVSIECDSRENV